MWNVKGTNLRKGRSKLWTIKWQKIHIYQQLSLKNKVSKQEEQRQNQGYGECFDGCQVGKNGWRGERIKKYKWVVTNSCGDIKHSLGNGVAKELIPWTMVNGLPEGVGWALWRGANRGKTRQL